MKRGGEPPKNGLLPPSSLKIQQGPFCLPCQKLSHEKNENWYLNFKDAPFISEISAICTKNSTWMTADNEKIFCKDGSLECEMPILPDCQDRTILCLESLPIPDG